MSLRRQQIAGGAGGFAKILQEKIWCGVLLMFMLAFTCAQAGSQSLQPDSVSYTVSRLEKPNGINAFGVITALLVDSSGKMWVGSEGKGLYCIAADRGGVEHFTVNNGLGDNYIYAIAEDHQGRIWVGHRCHGVSVYNGKSWRNYGVVDGPIGERIFDIAVEPSSGNIWMATSGGISRYSPTTHRWKNFTRSSGLPEDQITSIAFDTDGSILAGTLSHGLAIGKHLASGKIRWQNITAQGTWYDRLFNPRGEGLPSDQINDIIVAKDGYIYVATSEGLGIRELSGWWHYVRGKNVGSQIRQLYHAPGLGERISAFMKARGSWNSGLPLLLDGDYINTLADGGNGMVWLGTRGDGVGLYRTPPEQVAGKFKPSCIYRTPKEIRSDITTAISPQADGSLLVALYQKGLYEFIPENCQLIPVENKPSDSISSDSAIEFPRPPQPPSAVKLARLAGSISCDVKSMASSAGDSAISAVYLGEDWSTHGDWIGHYGSDAAMLCAMPGHGSHMFNLSSFNPEQRYWIKGMIGPHHRKGDTLRHWIHWAKTNQSRVLYNPIIGYRREAECDDHGEAYSWTYDGPDHWFAVRLLKGRHKISLYFINPNGQRWFSSARDYTIEIRKLTKIPTKPRNKYAEIPIVPDWPKVYAAPILAKTRVRQFYGGVYKSFLVNSPTNGTEYIIHIDRNHGINTIVSGIFIDKLPEKGRPMPWRQTAWLGHMIYRPPRWKLPETASLELTMADIIWHTLETNTQSPLYRKLRRRTGLALCRALKDTPAAEPLLENIRWQLAIYPKDHHTQFNAFMKEGSRRAKMLSPMGSPEDIRKRRKQLWNELHKKPDASTGWPES